MAYLAIPFSLRKISENTEYKTICKHPFSNYLICLSSSKVDIRSSNQKNCEVAKTFERTTESISDHGENEWIQFIDKEFLTFGTKSGYIFLVSYANLEIVSEYKCSKEINNTFTAYRHLAIVSNNNEVVFFEFSQDNNGVKIIEKTNYNFDFAKTPIHHTSFYHRFAAPSLLMIADDHPCLLEINKSALKDNKKKKLSQNIFPFENITNIALNTHKAMLTFSNNQGNVSFIYVNDENPTPIRIHEHENNIQSDIIFLRWSINEEILIIIYAAGKIILFEMSTFTIHITDVKELAECICVDYDDDTNSLYFVDKTNSLNACEFATLKNQYAFTSSSLIHIFKNEKNKIYNHEDIFPIKYVCPIKENICAVASTNKIKIGDKILNIEGIQGLISLNEYLYVFTYSHNEALNMLILNQDFELLKAIPFPHLMHSITTDNIDRIVVSCHTMYTIITVLTSYNLPDKKKKNKKKKKSTKEVISINDHFYLKIKTIYENLQMKAVIPVFNKKIAILYSNGSLKLQDCFVRFNQPTQNTNENIKKIGRFIFYEPLSEVLYVQLNSTYYMIKDMLSMEFNGIFAFANLIDVYYPPKDNAFGELTYIHNPMAPFLLNFKESNVPYMKKIKEHFPENLVHLMTLSNEIILAFNYHNCVKDTYQYLNQDDVIKILTESITRFENKPNSERGVCFIEKFFEQDIQWNKYFNSLSNPFKEKVLLGLNPNLLDELLLSLDKNILLDNPQQFLEKLIIDGNLLRTFRICASLTQTNFLNILHLPNVTKKYANMTLESSLKLIQNDKNRFNLNDEDWALRSMGSSLWISKFTNLSLAVFIVTQQKEKIKAILSINTHFIEGCKQLHLEDSKYSFLKGILDELTSSTS